MKALFIFLIVMLTTPKFEDVVTSESVTVLELFNSQVCSSCPTADAL